jgi:hypothetical protein
MITMIGNSVYSATSTDDLPAAIMMLMTSIYFFTTRKAIRSRHHNPVGKEMICQDRGAARRRWAPGGEDYWPILTSVRP